MGTFFLKNLPKRDLLERLARRYRDLDATAVETLIVLLRTASDIIARIDQQMARRGMSQGRYSVLMQLNIYPEPATPSELAQRLGVTRATITGLLDGLERDGLVRRERAGADRRSFRVSITKRGVGKLEGMIPGHYRRISGLMAGLSANERAKLTALLRKVAGGLAALEAR